MNRVGFIGVGQLARYTIRGWRAGGYAETVLLGPRNAQIAAELARDHHCTVLESNQAVVDESDTLFLATRPEHCADALRGLKFRPGQVLVSVAAGIPLEQLRAATAAQDIELLRAMPVSSAEAGFSPTLIYPDNAFVRELFERCGRALPVEEERYFDQGTILACVYSWYFALFAELVRATRGEALPEAVARELVAGMARGAADLTLLQHDAAPGAIADEIAREGTFSRLGLDLLLQRQAFEPWREACELLRSRLRQD